MIECKPYNMTMMTPTTCIKNQERLKQVLRSDSRRKTPDWEGSASIQIRAVAHSSEYFKIKQCHGCAMGQEFYKKHLKGEDIGMPTKEVKRCGCGTIFEREKGQGQLSWNRTMNCPKCRALSQYDRKKKHNSVKAKADESNQVVAEKPLESKVRKKGPQAPETKPCALDRCNGMLTRKPTDGESTWKQHLSCSDKCKAEARKRRKRDMTRVRRVAASFDSGEARQIAHDAATSVMDTFSAFLTDTSVLSHDQIKAIAIEAGIECQRRAAGVV